MKNAKRLAKLEAEAAGVETVEVPKAKKEKKEKVK